MLRKAILTLITILVLPSAAATLSFVPEQNGAQKEFKALIDKGNWHQALLAWNQSVGGTSFAANPNGQALHAYLLLQNGMPLLGSETVLQLNAKSLHPQMISLWKTELNNSNAVQKFWISAHKSWDIHIGPSIGSMALNTKSQVMKAIRYAHKLPKEFVRSKAAVLWQVATRAPLINETVAALDALKALKESGQTYVGQDQISLATARVLYQRGEIDAAIKAYQEVPKSSDVWFEAVEERSWAFFRKDDYDGALGQVTTILAPTFEKLVGPTPYFLSNLLSLKVCDYTRIFKTSDQFKQRNRTRLSEMQIIVTQGSNKAIPVAFEKMDQKGVTLEAIGQQADALPRALLRDREFRKNMQYRHQMLQELKKGQDLIAESALGTNAELERLMYSAKAKTDSARAKALVRVRQLAQSETKEFKQVLNKLHIIEAQVIERLHLDDNLKGERSKLTKVKDEGDVLVFPYTAEVWLDELDNYKARVKDCPTLKGASL